MSFCICCDGKIFCRPLKSRLCWWRLKFNHMNYMSWHPQVAKTKIKLKSIKVTPNLRGATFTEIIFFRSY